jgi:CRP-like cAMP-binding protein
MASISEKDRQLVERFLKRVSLFRNFSDEHLRRIIDDFKIISVKKGEDIVFRSDEGTDLYIVLKGKVKVSLLGPDGNEFILTTFGEGNFFGEMSLIDGKSRSANVVAEEEAFIGVLRREVFLNTMQQNPVIAFDLLTSLVERLRKADDMIETLAFLDVNERLIKFLVACSKGEGKKEKDGYYQTRKRTHMEIASHIGSSRESVSKALKVLALGNKVLEKDGYFFINSKAVDELKGS